MKIFPVPKQSVFAALACSLWFAVANLYAQTEEPVCVKSDALCRQVGSWEVSIAVGFGGRTNPLISGDEQPIFFVPQVSWYGKRFFMENLEFGFTLVDKPAHMVNLLVQPGFEQVYFDEFGIGNFTIDGNFSAALSGSENYGYIDGPLVTEGTDNPGLFPDDQPETERPVTNVRLNLDDLRERELAVLGGLEYNYYRGAWQIQLQVLHDVSSVHDGDEVRLSGSWQTVYNRNLFTLAAGLAWQSEELLDYYYGLDAGEIPNSDLTYEADDGVSAFAKVSWEKKLNDNWSLLSTLHFRKLDSSLTASPLVEETGVTTVFIGGRYHF